MRAGMRAVLSTVLLLGWAGSLPAQDPEAWHILKRAIQVHGGEANLNKHQATVARMKGTLYSPNLGTVPFLQESTFQAPEKFRDVLDIEVRREGESKGQKFTLLSVVNGDKGWIQRAPGQIEEMNDPAMAAMKEALHLLRVQKLTTLRDRSFTLVAMGEVRVGGRPALGLRVSAKGHQDVKLFFERDSGLLVETERQYIHPVTKKEITEERFMSDYRDVSGIKMPRKTVVYQDGKKFIEGEVIDIQFLDKIDDSEFAKP